MSAESTGMRIGELARRVGVGAPALRAWESRYGLMRPQRSTGGYRLYGQADERRIRAVLALREQGVTVSEACARVLAGDRLHTDLPEVAPRPTRMRAPGRSAASGRPDGGQGDGAAPEDGAAGRDGAHGGAADAGSGRAGARRVVAGSAFAGSMHDAVDAYDEIGVHSALDRLFTEVPLASALDDAVMPFLTELGERWTRDEVTVAQEHFVSGIMQRRLGALMLGRYSARGPVAVLAAPSGEHHDLALLGLAALMTRAGWRLRYLGADTPSADILSAAEGACLVVLSATVEQRLLEAAPPLEGLADRVILAVGGPGATERAAKSLNAVRLPSRLGEAAAQLSTLRRKSAS